MTGNDLHQDGDVKVISKMTDRELISAHNQMEFNRFFVQDMTFARFARNPGSDYLCLLDAEITRRGLNTRTLVADPRHAVKHIKAMKKYGLNGVPVKYSPSRMARNWLYPVLACALGVALLIIAALVLLYLLFG
jgi:hypothetical protein